ncbi:hypothetical protein RF55_14823 [Lasius niger]|uniref:Integrase catalytic domain-containing protein n=1 Tax=Lasius niger TaxID=67767 RepID=A0A0J7K7S0_LASNI|nr:hypothetical protein RF55_14823 [Lasius niger]
MYRQILVHSSHTPLQRILWRNDENDKLETFELTTVTYGTSPASFLATRCLKYLAEIEGVHHPQAAEAVLRDFYMDDLLTGSNSLSEAKALRNQIIELLDRGGFQLRKWSSNSPELLQDFPGAACQDSLLTINKEAKDRTLGLQWCSNGDYFQVTVSINENKGRITKRSILSRIAQIFDPLGLIGPVIIVAKMLMQQLWQLQMDWDSSIPASLHTEWLQFEREIQELNGLRVPRLVIACWPYIDIQLHGFCDASMRAYGACIYIRITDKQNNHFARLLCSKSRLAPIKCISLPRLELCGAVLLSQLINKVLNANIIKFNRVYLWSDSTIVLSWLRSMSSRWAIFVANRVGEIQRCTKIDDWHHVPTKYNPADLISRGVMPSQLVQSSLWWSGPSWLQCNPIEWPKPPAPLNDTLLPEQRKTVVNLVMQTSATDQDVFQRYSDLNKLTRIIAWCRRFYKNCKSRENRLNETLSVMELEEALYALCKQAQGSHFGQEIQALINKQRIPPRSRLLNLNPFLDEKDLLRVGGRLRKSSLPYSAKHQILLPTNHALTQLIIRHFHERNLHTGPQATLAAIRHKFWPLNARTKIRKIIRDCIVCFRANPIGSCAIMGELPSHRVHPSRPFSICGVDYGGPLYIREGRRRNAKTVKAYIAIFVCFSTKAVHIELVSDMSSETFINALKRFMARRGKVSHIYSDNGTNFVGASKELQELYNLLKDEQHKLHLEKFLSEDNITWHFIPPNAPNFGGLWEAAIKSTKTHLKRITGQTSLNYEEMYTLLAQIEAILNSRPITAMSSDPNDLSFLTPGHFLIGDSLNTTAEPDITRVQQNRLSRWQHVEQMRQHFWNRWSTEYLNQLQQRTKWKVSGGRQLLPGCLVLVQQRGLTPLQWILGRVIKVHPGADGIARTATIRTSKGVLDRPLTKLCILPLEM